MSIRRKRRQRGKRKVLRREALKTWAALTWIEQEESPEDWLKRVTIPMVRKMMPQVIAQSIVGVQPMTMPTGMIANAANGIHPPSFSFRYSRKLTNKEYADERKRNRHQSKKNKKRIAEAAREDTARTDEGLGQAGRSTKAPT